MITRYGIRCFCTGFKGETVSIGAMVDLESEVLTILRDMSHVDEIKPYNPDRPTFVIGNMIPTNNDGRKVILDHYFENDDLVEAIERFEYLKSNDLIVFDDSLSSDIDPSTAIYKLGLADNGKGIKREVNPEITNQQICVLIIAFFSKTVLDGIGLAQNIQSMNDDDQDDDGYYGATVMQSFSISKGRII